MLLINMLCGLWDMHNQLVSFFTIYVVMTPFVANNLVIINYLSANFMFCSLVRWRKWKKNSFWIKNTNPKFIQEGAFMPCTIQSRVLWKITVILDNCRRYFIRFTPGIQKELINETYTRKNCKPTWNINNFCNIPPETHNFLMHIRRMQALSTSIFYCLNQSNHKRNIYILSFIIYLSLCLNVFLSIPFCEIAPFSFCIKSNVRNDEVCLKTSVFWY